MILREKLNLKETKTGIIKDKIFQIFSFFTPTRYDPVSKNKNQLRSNEVMQSKLEDEVRKVTSDIESYIASDYPENNCSDTYGKDDSE